MDNLESGLRLRHYYYRLAWEEEYFVVPFGDSCTCLVCGFVFGTNRKFNVQRHYRRYHAVHDTLFPRESAARKNEIAALKARLMLAPNQLAASALNQFMAPASNQFVAPALNQSVAPAPTELIKTSSSATTMLSFKIAFILAKAMKPFEDGAMAKEIIITTVNELLEDGEEKDNLLTKVRQIQLSKSTVTRRMKAIAANISYQLTADLQKCKWFSLQIDESTDAIAGSTQLKIFTRMVFDDCTVMEELLAIIPIKSRTPAQEIFAAFKDNLIKNSVPLNKLVSITVGNGSPALVNRDAGLIGLCQRDPDFPMIVGFHCVIHQLSLCSRSLDVTHVMEPVRKIVSLIQGKPSEHRLFQSLLEKAESDCKYSLLDTEVRWLSRGELLEKFYEALPQIKIFLESRGEKFEQLEDQSWLQDLAFWTDLTKSINELNAKIKGENTSIWTLVSHVSSFRETVSLWIEFFRANEVCDRFEKLEKVLLELGVLNDFCGERFACYLEKLKEILCKRFLEFYSVEIISKYLHLPMAAGDTAEIAARIVDLFPDIKKTTLQQEMVAFRNDDNNRWKISTCAAGIEQFWPTVDETEYRNLVSVFKQMLSCFGSSYLCDSMFTLIKNVKSRLRSRLTDDNLDGLMRISVSSYQPNFETLCEETHSQALIQHPIRKISSFQGC